MQAHQDGAGRPVRSVGRALALYTTLRVLLFLSVFVVLQLVLEPALLALGAAVLLSAVASIPLLRPWRDDLARASEARHQARQAARSERRSRLDEG